ncbi:hypothetical protein DIU31_025675 [Mucilaginibacter rubeus]|uniref:Uncharacterized protein n=1 Tax=Mucilaginibacter rubeus TaxID=2027860 RepID=A0AAE6JJ27_9SPHI|nr:MULTISPECIES: hypothetical protein [Mucilaginibacter]QEM06732.1 hypothetical protein DIU31_025675 [Mucilaginibacter rubeus]QEM19320.1 hypothetical protein DIU38_025960 [Mucilaginibacter gossypii]QTE44136.1 hypothetical protein J3L19_01770 [Mucilaginibacter rubeus]QTE50737.1 hypothetical protein J3L21_01750 [Mucilaginibacter rubeus]QTE55819.1 hypothetical protein J3L23_26985 [Mucilaginibacter rubeus]
MKRVQAQKPFIYYETLKQWEIITVVIYALITVVIILSPFVFDIETRQNSVIFYAILTQLSLLFLLYVSLRNFRSYLIWLGFGIIHFMLFLWFQNDTELDAGMANPSVALANTLPLLLLFQLLRFFSINTQQKEFGVPSKGGRTDWIEDKKITGIDCLAGIIYFGAWLGLSLWRFGR